MWEQLKLARESPTFDENNTDSQEVINDVLGRQITREYLDVVKAILTSGGGSDLSQNSTNSSLTASSESLNKGNNIDLIFYRIQTYKFLTYRLCNFIGIK